MYSIDSVSWPAKSKGMNRQTIRVTMASPHLDTISLVIRTIGYSRVCRIKLHPQRKYDPSCLLLMHVSAFASWHGGDEIFFTWHNFHFLFLYRDQWRLEVSVRTYGTSRLYTLKDLMNLVFGIM